MKLHPDVTHPLSIARFQTLESDLYAIFGDRLDFTDSVYFDAKTKMEYRCVFCDEPHTMTSNHLLQGKGCPTCGQKRTKEASRLQAIKAGLEFADRCEVLHPNKYLYHLVKYINNRTPVEIWCISCNSSFWITPSNILKGHGCRDCSYELRGSNQASTTPYVIGRIEAIHGDDIDTSDMVYVSAKKLVKLRCRLCSKVFFSTPDVILSGCGCHYCSKGGFDYNKMGYLYYLRVETFNQIAYKIGITNLSVKKRFSIADLEKITIINIEHFENGKDAYDKEQSILKQFKEYKYKGEDILDSGGNTELFTKDVLKLDRDLEEMKK